MFCSTCGEQVPESNRFCNACGAAAEPAAAAPGVSGANRAHPFAPPRGFAPSYPAAPPATPVYRPAHPPMAVPAHHGAASPPRGRAGRTISIVLLTIFLTLGAVAGVGYWTWSSPPTVDAGVVQTMVIGAEE